MTIYIESFLIQNILINFCLLRLVYLTTKSKTSTFKLVLSAIVGAIFSVVCAYLLTSNLIMNAIKLITSIAMIIIAFNVNFKQFLFDFILLFAYTYAVFGAIIALSSASYFTSFGVVTASKINLNLIAILVIVLSYIFELVCKHIKFKIKSNNLIFPITLIDNGNKVKIDAYLDTGNLLNVAGEPVIVVDASEIMKLKKINFINLYLYKGETVATNTVCGSDNLKIFKIDSMQLKIGKEIKNYTNQLVAVNLSNTFKNTNYKALLSPLLL